MLHQRTSEQIRTDAIKMGIKKAQEGCLSCAYGYFTLAKQHGASDDEIRQKVDEAAESDKPGVQRRDVLKMIAAGGLAAMAGGLTIGVGTAGDNTSQARSVSAWWGTDSNSQACCYMPQNFYIGRMGYGVEPVGDAYFFNISAARVAGNPHTYGYWGLVGPGYRGGWSPYDWGRKQADCAWNAWNHGPNAPYIGGRTVFADVEPGFGGWSFGDYGNNQGVMNGFLRELRTISHASPGLYISPYYWRSLVGVGFKPSTDYVLWITGCDTCGGDLCSPCNFSCNTLTTVRNRLAATVNNVSLGGHKPVVWQYWISNCGCGDYNVMTQNARSLSPARTKKLYQGC